MPMASSARPMPRPMKRLLLRIVDDRAALDREEDVGGDRPDAGGDREVEERVDRADRALHRRGVLVGHPLAMRRKLRGRAPGRRPRRRARARASTKPFRARAGRPRVPWCSSFVASCVVCDQLDFAVIHTVRAIRRADAEDPDEEALRDGAERAERESARRLVLLQEEQRRDDVALVFGRQGQVVEHGHVLRAGDHRRVHVQGAGLVERRCVLALGEGAAGGCDVVAHRAVDAEELGAAGDVALAVEDLLVGEGRAGSRRLHVRGHREDLLLGELRPASAAPAAPAACSGMRPVADLELDRELADAVQRRAGRRCPAGRGRGRWRSSPGTASCRLRRSAPKPPTVLGGRGHRRGCAGVHAAGDQEADADEGGCSPGTAAAVRAALGLSCHVGDQLRSISGSR